MELIAVIMKAPTSTQRFESAKALLNYGFATYALDACDAGGSPARRCRCPWGQQATVQPVLGEDSAPAAGKGQGRAA